MGEDLSTDYVDGVGFVPGFADGGEGGVLEDEAVEGGT